MAWLEAVSHVPFDGELPGVPGTKLKLSKNESTYSGCITLGDDLYSFRDASMYHVAGSVAVALGEDADHAPALCSPALAKLGKSIDLLVKSRTLRKMAKPKGGAAGGKGIQLPGVAAQPQQPMAPTPPIPEAPKPTGPAAGSKTSGTPAKEGDTKPGGTAKPAPGTKPAPKKPSLKVTKAEARRECPACGGQQFKADRFTACLCFQDLAKSVKTTLVDGGYLLEFGAGWDHDAVTTLAENLGK
jgi:hypothetical protein